VTESKDLQSSLAKETSDLERLIKETHSDKQSVESEIRGIASALQERADRLSRQLAELDQLTQDKAARKREIENLNYSVKDLSRAINRYKDESVRLQEEKELMEEKVGELEALVAKRDEEITEMEGYLADKERIISQLEQSLKALDNKPVQPKPLPKGDLLDEMIGQYIYQANCPVPIKKLGNGYYIFGTRKIYAKILNGKLVIRVGGGFMIIEEFINTYAEQELNKINKI
jgi:DNA repair exonuclease SbcCD ATPase subunit